MAYRYSTVQIQSALNLLNGIKVSGIENCKKIAMIEAIIQSPQEEETNDGNDSKEE